METQAAPETRSWPARLVNEVREHAFGYGVMAAFVVAGPVVTRLLFPEAPLALGIVGGLIFGGYAALCAAPQKFL